MEPKVGLTFGDWLTGYTAFPVQQSIYRNKKVMFWFADVVPWAEATPRRA